VNDLDPTLRDHYFVDLLVERMVAADFGRTWAADLGRRRSVLLHGRRRALGSGIRCTSRATYLAFRTTAADASRSGRMVRD
jgi:hypothetical protein